jgi:peptide/nickel transport system substrate-binding protein
MKQALLLAFSLAACAPAADAPPRQLADAAQVRAYPRSDYVEPEPGRRGGRIRISTASDTGTLDLQTIAATNPKWIGRLIFDNLVYLDERGNITPWLARSWTISPDGLTYTFHLRQDVSFSDGTPFDAAAVKANLDRIVNPTTKTAMTAAYIAPYAQGRVIDRYTFEARLREPYTPFLNVLAQSWLGMVSPRSLAGSPAALSERPVGTGPFVVTSYRRQKGIRLDRRADYRWAPDFIGHRGPAYADGIDIDFVPEALIRTASLAAGQYDLNIDAPPQDVAQIEANPDLALASRVNLGNPTRAITFNTQRAPFDDVRIRRAFALAIDREGITAAIGFGTFRPTTRFLSSTTQFVATGAQQPSLVRDLPTANQLLDEAGWTGRNAQGYRMRGGKELGATVFITDAGNPGPVVVALQADARRIGFRLTINQLTTPQLTVRRNAGDYQALGPGYWHTNTPDGLYIVYQGRQIIRPGFIGQNTARIADRQLDALLLAARHSRDPARLADLYAQAQARLAEIVPAVPLHENHTLLAYRRSLRGLIFDTSHNVPFLTTAWLAETRS